jgi:hypothetical protein
VSVAVSAPVVNGRHDPAMRRRSIRKGRETGCSVYIPGEALARAGFAPGDPPPFYRVWGGKRGRYVVVLYREP